MDYYSFEDVMHELELGEEEIKRMVSEGELRAFRDENKMKFRKEDVESLKKGRITEPTIILPSTPGTPAEETVLDLDIGQETEALSDTQIPKVAEPTPTRRPSPPKPVEKEEEELVVQEVGSESEETFLEEETDTGTTTEPLKLADEETVEAPVVEEVLETTPSGRTSRARGSRRMSAQIPVAVEEEIERRRASPVWTFLILLALIASAYGGFFFFDLMRMETGKTDQPSGITAGMAQWVLDEFWKDKNWRNFHEKEWPETKAPGDPQDSNNPYTRPSFRQPRTAAPPTGP